MKAAILYVLAGIAGGVMGGMGLGGGTLLIPLLTLFLGVAPKQAAAINLVSFIPMSVVSCIIHAKNKLLDFKKAFLVAVPACITSVLSSLLAQKVKGEAVTKGFAVFLIVLAVSMLASRSAALVKDAFAGLSGALNFPRAGKR